MWLRQSTASQEILLGPFVDSTDGNTQETALTIANTDIKLWKEGGTTEASKNSGGATHIASGRYYAVLDATDTDTLGKLEVTVHVSGALAVRREFMVLSAMVYDSLVLGTDRFDTNVTHINDVSASAVTTIKAVQGLAVDGVITTLTNLPAITANWLTATGIAADAITAAKIADGAIDAATFAASAITATVLAADCITAAKIADGAIDAATFAAGAINNAAMSIDGSELTAIPWNAAWDAEVQSECNDALVANNLDHLVLNAVDTNFATTVHLDSVIGHLADAGTTATFDRTTDALEVLGAATAPSAASIADAVWDEALSGHLSAGSTGEALNAAGSAGDPWTTTLPGAYTGSQAGKILADVLVDTGTTLQAELDGIQADTEDIQTRLPAALVSGRMDSNMQAAANGVITAAVIATGAIDADALAADAVTEIWAGSTAPSAATVADAVWDEDATAHQTQGTFGQAIGDPGADSDTIWALANTNLDAAVSSRMATYAQPTGFLAATFPGTVASTTNITAGTITTATNVTTVNGLAAGVITAASIATGAIDADALAADAVDEFWDETIGDSTITARQALRLFVASLAGKLSGAATTTVTIRNAADTANVIVATVDADGNRSAVTLNP